MIFLGSLKLESPELKSFADGHDLLHIGRVSQCLLEPELIAGRRIRLRNLNAAKTVCFLPALSRYFPAVEIGARLNTP